jgi:MATE family multidrug resistance protein
MTCACMHRLLGLAGALETCAGQAYGAEAFGLVGEVLQQALATALLCCCGVLGLWACMKPLMMALGQVSVDADTCMLGWWHLHHDA